MGGARREARERTREARRVRPTHYRPGGEETRSLSVPRPEEIDRSRVVSRERERASEREREGGVGGGARAASATRASTQVLRTCRCGEPNSGLKQVFCSSYAWVSSGHALWMVEAFSADLLVCQRTTESLPGMN